MINLFISLSEIKDFIFNKIYTRNASSTPRVRVEAHSDKNTTRRPEASGRLNRLFEPLFATTEWYL
jgi:hypothetical protein